MGPETNDDCRRTAPLASWVSVKIVFDRLSYRSKRDDVQQSFYAQGLSPRSPAERHRPVRLPTETDHVEVLQEQRVEPGNARLHRNEPGEFRRRPSGHRRVPEAPAPQVAVVRRRIPERRTAGGRLPQLHRTRNGQVAEPVHHPIRHAADQVHENVAYGLPVRARSVESVYEQGPGVERRAVPERAILEARVGGEIGHRGTAGNDRKPTARQ